MLDAEKKEKPLYYMVKTPEDVQKLSEKLAEESIIAADMEADSMYHFQERVCLLQIRANGINYVIDTFTAGDLAPVAGIFSDPSKTIIFHSADYDIRCLKRDFGIKINSLFDTQIAAKFIGVKETGLANVLESRLGVHIEKKYQKSNWAKRPLTENMLKYAASDTRYLPALARNLEEELMTLGRLSWVREECEILQKVKPVNSHEAPLFQRFKGAGKMDRLSLAVLESVLVYRLDQARKMNRPPFKVLGNIPIMEIVEKKPTSLDDLCGLKKITPKQIKLFGEPLLKAINKGLDTPENDLPVYPRKTRVCPKPHVALQVNILKRLRDEKAEFFDLEPHLILTNLQIRAIAQNANITEKILYHTKELRNWQKEVLGEDILKALG